MRLRRGGRQIEDALNVINEEVTRLNRVVLDFLFAVRPMDSKPEIRDINVLLKELLHFLKYELEEAKVEINVQLGEIPFIEMDEKYIKSISLYEDLKILVRTPYVVLFRVGAI